MKVTWGFVLCIAICALAEDLYSPYEHGTVILNRIKRIKNQNIRNEKTMLRLEQRERRVLDMLHVLYNDMKIAVDQKDRVDIERKVEREQLALNRIRRQKRVVLRRMRHLSDKIAEPYRDRIVRKTRTEERVGYDYNSHIRREIAINQEALTKETMALAQKYATMAGEIAAVELSEKFQKKGGNVLKAKAQFEKVTKDAYTKTYKKIVNKINEATIEGVDLSDIKMVCYSAIEDFAQKLENKYLLVVKSQQKASDIAKKVDKKPLRMSLKKLAGDFAKKATKNAKKVTKNAKKATKTVKAVKKAKKVTKKVKAVKKAGPT